MTPSTHDLNRILADVCGKSLHASAKGDYWLVVDEDENELVEWDPCHNHHDMAEVKAALRQCGVEIVTMTVNLLNHWIVELITYKGKYEAKHESELIALALAVEAMQKGER